ncbi:MAG: hypothetical protein QXU91_06365 [Thermofilum sp.]
MGVWKLVSLVEMPSGSLAHISRLDEALRACVELAGSRGYVTASELAARMGAGERMARNYLVDLREVGALEYVGGGRYVLTGAAREGLLGAEVFGEGLTVEGVASRVLWRAEVLDFMVERAYRLVRAVEGLADREGLRRRLLELSPPEGFAGDRLVASSREVSGRRVERLAGEAGAAQVESYVFMKLMPVTVVFVCSAAAITRLDEWGRVSSLELRRRPDARDFKGGEPFDEGLAELALEYPELLVAGRRIAARLLLARLRLRNVLDALESGVELVVSKGTLLPHGFLLPGSELLKMLQGEVEELFRRAQERAAELGVPLASITAEPRDYRFCEAVGRELGLRLQRVSDAVLLTYLLEPWEYTAPMELREERGRRVENWFEFYWKVGSRLLKVEYVAREDPVGAQRALIASLAPNMQVGGSPTGVAEAEVEARRHLRWVKLNFTLALKRAAGGGGS